MIEAGGMWIRAYLLESLWRVSRDERLCKQAR